MANCTNLTCCLSCLSKLRLQADAVVEITKPDIHFSFLVFFFKALHGNIDLAVCSFVPSSEQSSEKAQPKSYTYTPKTLQISVHMPDLCCIVTVSTLHDTLCLTLAGALIFSTWTWFVLVRVCFRLILDLVAKHVSINFDLKKCGNTMFIKRHKCFCYFTQAS